ncbi:MAG: hypothetical protein NTW72_07245, partial [Gemmatimonadetes bacterium]|nr:hypothetical protein [Gemmatimonadota bacterium]
DCPSTYRVMKFGGSSLGDPERLVRVVGIIGHEHETNGPVAIVVSAFGDTTERLRSAVTAAAAGHIEPATQIADTISQAAIDIGTRALQGLVPGADAAPVRAAVYERVEALRSLLFGVSLVREMTPQTVDSVVSFGERIASAVVAAVLTVSGRPAVAVDARSWTVTDDAFGAALVDWEATQSRLDALPRGAVASPSIPVSLAQRPMAEPPRWGAMGRTTRRRCSRAVFRRARSCAGPMCPA